MDSTESTIATAFMAQSYHATQRHRERAWG
jgi:hypothetical protein